MYSVILNITQACGAFWDGQNGIFPLAARASDRHNEHTSCPYEWFWNMILYESVAAFSRYTFLMLFDVFGCCV